VDMDDDSDDFSKNEFIGYCEKTIGDLIGGRKDGVYTTQLSNEIPKDMSFKNSKGRKPSVIPSISIRIKEVVDNGGTFVMDISGIGLDKKVKTNIFKILYYYNILCLFFYFFYIYLFFFLLNFIKKKG